MKDKWFRIAFLAIILMLGYLFALNGRYYVDSRKGLLIDKWEKRIISFRKLDVEH